MLKTVVIGTTALFLAASSVANAQSSQTSPPATTPERLTKADRNTLTDMRVDLVKAALQLTPEQEKLWPPVESAIRANAENRSARIARIQETVGRRAMKAVPMPCAIVIPSPFYNDARKHWLNDHKIWIGSPRRGSRSTIQ